MGRKQRLPHFSFAVFHVVQLSFCICSFCDHSACYFEYAVLIRSQYCIDEVSRQIHFRARAIYCNGKFFRPNISLVMTQTCISLSRATHKS